jgi:putative membrane protein
VHTVLAHWSASWPVLLAYAVAAGAHLDGLAGLLRHGGQAARPAAGPAATRRELTREAALFQAGLLTAMLALVSPIGYWSGVYIWVHALQDLLLAFVAPGLIVVGAPWLALRYRWPRRASRPAGPAAASRPDGPAASRPVGPAASRPDGRPAPARVPWLLARPVAVVVAVNVGWLAWHLPAAYDLARAGGGLGGAERATYLGAGIAFWLQLTGSRPYRPSAAPLRRAALIVGTVLAGTVLGMVLVFGSGVLYPAYGGAAHHVMTVLDDQQLAGAVLWMGMLPPLIFAAVAILTTWLGDEEARETSAGLDRLLSRPRSSWPSGPGLR